MQPARGGRQRDLGVHVVGTGVDQGLYAPVVNQPLPVRVRRLRAVALGGLFDPGCRASGDGNQQRVDGRRPEDGRDALEGQQMRSGDTVVSEHSDADLLRRARGHSTAWATLWIPAVMSEMSWSGDKGGASRWPGRWRIGSGGGNCPLCKGGPPL